MPSSGVEVSNTASASTSFVERRPCSIIDALELPPSPILTSSNLTTRMSEDVPVFLFNSASNEDISSRRCSNVPSFNLSCSSSSDSIQTAGTFGQFRKPQHYNNPYQAPIIPSEAFQTISGSSDSSPPFSPLDLLETWTIELNSAQPEVPLQGSTFSPYPYLTSCCSSDTLSGLSYETENISINYSRRAGDLHSMSTLTSLHCDSVVSLPNILSVSQPRHARKASSASESSSLSRISLPLSSMSGPMSSHTELPHSLAWLKDTIVEMLIDQEGFRSITPSFRFAGFSTNTRSLDPSDKVLEGGAAQFIPISRQTFRFHYAPFDGQPVLRRISINGMSRDHVSRQATLCLKSNGVYTVRGTETSLVPFEGVSVDSSAEAPKLHWKFDYFVDNRKGSGRCEGEKIFTPLTFSCSPLLLHPLQGKKIRLVHVVKKSVVTKLVAERLELPKTTSSRSSTSAPRELSSPKMDLSKAHLWNLHRRFQSHGHSNNHKRSDSTGARISSPLGANRVNEAQYRDQRQVSRRHIRASSAGEIAVVNLSISGYPDVGEKKPALSSHGGPLISYDRHILPPSKLSELLENIENTKSQLHKADQVLSGLTPAPRYNPRSFVPT